MKVCAVCGKNFKKPRNVSKGAWKKRRLCSIACRTESNKKHGFGGDHNRPPEYGVWQAMVQRCTNPNCKTWHRYGGRGIRVCDRWRTYENFIADMGPRPSAAHSIDRIDNNRGYTPSNCRWVTIRVQANNTRWNRRIMVKGRTATIAEWARITGLKGNTILCRLRAGWTPERAVTTKPIDMGRW